MSNEDIDIAFIGSGLSSTFTLIEYINQLEEMPSLKTSHGNDSVRIIMFEKILGYGVGFHMEEDQDLPLLL